MNPEPKKPQYCEDDEDEVTMARSIVDEVIKETESEDWENDNDQDLDKIVSNSSSNAKCSSVGKGARA